MALLGIAFWRSNVVIARLPRSLDTGFMCAHVWFASGGRPTLSDLFVAGACSYCRDDHFSANSWGLAICM